MSTVSPEPPALYYPYIHIRDENWLKATLLNFRKVYRMVPIGQYAPEDDDSIIPYTDTEHGRREPFVDTIDTSSAGARDSQRELLVRLQQNHDQILARFGQRSDGDTYYLHDQKLHEPLREHLLKYRLAWPDNDAQARGHRNWLGLHPTLGSGVMTTLGLSIAEQFGYDIVTNSNQDHETLISTTTNDIIDRLLGIKERPNAPDQGAVANELGQLIITRTINLKAITIDDIKELHENTEDFRQFRQYLTSAAASIGPVGDTQERHKRLKQRAAEIIEAWHTYQSACLARFSMRSSTFLTFSRRNSSPV
jgi:hypothetical protein